MREGLTDAAPSTDLPSMLTSAGLEVLSAQGARESLDPPLSAVARRMVCGHLRRTRRHLNELLDDEDLEAIDILSDPDDRRGVMHRSDVFVAASREIAIARRVGE